MGGGSHSSPRLVLAVWGVVILALALLGTGIGARLQPASLSVPGTQSAKTTDLLERRFGESTSVAILLTGPAGAIDRQGPRLVAELERAPDVRVLSPWQPGGAPQLLRPKPTAVLLVADFRRPDDEAMSSAVPEAERAVEKTIGPPLQSHMSGLAVIGRALRDASLDATHRAELIAIPILLLVLLLVFKTPVAAALPLLLGAATVLAGRGLLWLATFVISVNSLGVAIASMMGLALGVDYALLMVSRYRQEREAGVPHGEAVERTGSAAGRTVLFAGSTLVVVMLTASLIAPGDMLGSVAAGVAIAGVLSIALALSAVPALLTLFGDRLERWRLPSAGGRNRTLAFAERLVARPAVAIPVVLALVLALAAPAAALRVGPPDARQLPASDPARQSYEAIGRAIGPGWVAPIVVVASARDGVISEPHRMRALAGWQDQVAHEPGVAAVIGPAELSGESAMSMASGAYQAAPRRLQAGQAAISALSGGLRRAGAGVGALRAGLRSAASGAATLGEKASDAGEGAASLSRGARSAREGAGELAAKTGEAEAGAERLAAKTAAAKRGEARMRGGLARSEAGSRRLRDGLREAASAAERLAAGQGELADGSAELAEGLRRLDDSLREPLEQMHSIAATLRTWAAWIRSLRLPAELVADRLDTAMRELETMAAGSDDPRYADLLATLREAAAALGAQANPGAAALLPRLEEVQDRLAASLESLAELPGGFDELAAGIGRLRSGAEQLEAGSLTAQQGSEELRASLGRLASGGQRLATGIGSLHRGAARMESSLDRLASGAGRLGGGLGALRDGAGRLDGGLSEIAGGAGRLEKGLERITAGAGQLSGGLSGGERRSARLSSGLDEPQQPLALYSTALRRYEHGFRQLDSLTPGAIDSGYLLLTALDGTVPGIRDQIAQTINIDSGGQATRMLVVADSAPNTAATTRLSRRLRQQVPALERASDSEVAIGRGALSLLDYQTATSASFPLLALALSAVSFVMLVFVLRSLPLPLLAVALTLLTIAAAFGALELMFGINFFEGPRYISAVSAAGVFTIMFVLAIDYEVFLLTRMRESWVAHGDHRRAITEGLRNTAGVITGAAVIMSAVFLAFASCGMASLAQFGAGLTVAVLLDATVVRLVLLPASMRALGPRVWWLPAWLDRALPELAHAGPVAASPEAVPAPRTEAERGQAEPGGRTRDGKWRVRARPAWRRNRGGAGATSGPKGQRKRNPAGH